MTKVFHYTSFPDLLIGQGVAVNVTGAVPDSSAIPDTNS